MSYSATNLLPAVPTQDTPASGSLMGAAVGAVIGAVVLAGIATASPSSMYATTTLRPTLTGAAPSHMYGQSIQMRSIAGAPYAAQHAAYEGHQEVIAQPPQGIAVYSWAFVICSAVAGAINGLAIWKNRQVAIAATTGRREALMAGVAAAGMVAGPAYAAYGDSANVFGKPKDVEQFFEVSGEGWSAKMPGKYNVSKEREVDGMVGRWEDNFDAVNNSYVLVQPIGKNSVSELGSIDDVRNSIVTPLLGKQAFEGQSISEGGFAPGRYASAAILDQGEENKNGKTYYVYELLTRTADGNEGGRHQLFKVTASNGKLYVFKAQAGDKRWFKGLERPLRASVASFTVA